ncbi:MAG: hypothetical protein IH588_09495 [Anaerolineales bacterium]|nr:hypothetical protein [Anaerolineales bacterium]
MAKINIKTQGRSGKVQYIEGSIFKKNTCEFYWEFGGADVIVTVWFPAEDKWDAQYPWASGRHKEILTFVANELRRTQAPSSTIKWESDRFHLVQA